MILCDIGNTTFNFLVNGKQERYFLDESLPNFDETIYFVSVNKKASKKLHNTYTNCIDLEKFVDFKSEYKGLGLDRKIACMGFENAIIVDAGSAITVDIMKEGIHCGGLILPGFKNYKSLYKDISPALAYEINTKVKLDKIPLCTQDAISYSILKSIILPIKDLVEKEPIIFTGGDGEFLSGFFENSIYKKDLIFDNMKGIIDANNCITKGKNS